MREDNSAYGACHSSWRSQAQVRVWVARGNPAFLRSVIVIDTRAGSG